MSGITQKSMIEAAAQTFAQGGIIAYPTEAVFGLGCDPDNTSAIERLLSLKQRSPDKGFILLASNYSQLQPYIDEAAISEQQKVQILSRWPGAITQVLPINNNISPLLSGVYKTIAVRITQHPDVIALCRKTGKAIISTSANLSGQSAATTWQNVVMQFPTQLDYLIKTNTLGNNSPSTIIDGITSKILRP
ncbi:L-threonylcarbamoyladenylate synthase [Colwellia psychrerythraea]|uniref:Threonylcarbamoyl-AMP synthase n=1 Tax=Colwellia psychrerythraea TaxID=28229 RepID=A0A099L2P1_COLPS|nr:L-threonylcarbamoyladenylate synthase [Colwellia psychrerythraea]KGJ96720.1 ribosome maturation factor rimN [Colwellia psychrerythraea]